ncbi:MAG: hypothetical protein HFH39_11990 [Lachnospiraceae bacterium]|nr:hypothetical protein [Lachnospiraceae bacterium]
MRKKIVTMLTALAVFCSAVFPGMDIGAAQPKASETGTTYYVSTISGKDTNDGKSQQRPFYSLQKIGRLDLKPGDKVLLECGSVFKNGYLHLFGQSGSADHPIVIDRYGTGADPIIDTNGQGIWFQNYGYRLDNTWHQYQGYVSSSILLYDSEYIEIQNLEIVNRNPKIDTVYNAVDMMDRTGVAAVAQDKGTIDHIHLKNLNIHDVIGNVYNKHMNNGGIYFTVYMPHDAQTENRADGTKDFVSSETGVPRFNDVLIDGCSVVNTNRWGIAVGYTALWGKFTGMEISDEDIAKYGSTNVVVQNNYVKDAGGDSITMMYCDKPLVQYNVSDGAARQMHSGDYGPQGETQRFAAGIWPWKCKDAVFQYNEAFDTKNTNNDNGDGQAWDADWSDGTIYQYNYSHNNEGGCLMVCLNEAYRTTFRYNISQNDLRAVLDTFGSPQAHIYNNVFYVADNVPIYRSRSNGTAVLENNIFYYSGETPKTEEWTVGNNKTYSNNLYYNYENQPEDAAGVTVAKGTQVFENPGKAPVSTVGERNPHEKPDAESVFDGYKLCAGSPAIGAGKSVTDKNGYEKSKTDFFGTDLQDVTNFDIGAYQSEEEEEIKAPGSPQNLSASGITETEAKLSWDAPKAGEEVKGYRIKESGKLVKDLSGSELSAATNAGKVTYGASGLKAGTAYTYTVITYNEKGLESEPAEVRFTTQQAPSQEKPSQPSGLSASPTQTTVTITWTAVKSDPEVLGYKIMDGAKTLLNVTGEKLAAATNNAKVSVKLSGLKAATTYKLSLVAYNANGNSAPRYFTFKTKSKPSIQLNKKTITLYTKTANKAKLKATVTAISGKVKWSSSKPSVAAVSSKGVVTAKKAGTAVIKAAIGKYKAVCTVKVKKPMLKVKKTSITIKKGKKIKLGVTVAPKAKITFKSSNKKVVKVTDKGIIKGLKKGSCKITVKCNGLTKMIKVKVK